MMGGSSGLVGGMAKTILLIAVLVAILSGVAGLMASNNLTEIPIAQAEAAGMQANIDQQRDQWAMQQPYYEQQLAADNAVAVAKSEQERQLIEAETAAALAQIEASTASHEASLYDQRQMAMAAHEQSLVAADRWNLVLTVAASVGILAVACIMMMGMYIVLKRVPAQQQAAVAVDPWQNPVFRRQQIDMLRKMDEERRAANRNVQRSVYPNGDGPVRRIRPSVN